jgi:hypothetical protein
MKVHAFRTSLNMMQHPAIMTTEDIPLRKYYWYECRSSGYSQAESAANVTYHTDGHMNIDRCCAAQGQAGQLKA